MSYYGAGLTAGQCGFTINSVEEKHNGDIKCSLGTETESMETVGTMRLIVASEFCFLAPFPSLFARSFLFSSRFLSEASKSPELELTGSSKDSYNYKINDILHASCIVRDGRPVANISWYLGAFPFCCFNLFFLLYTHGDFFVFSPADDEPIYDGLGMPTVVDLVKEDLQTKIQNVTRTLLPSDNGRTLKCVASHPALLGENSVAARQLDVKCELCRDRVSFLVISSLIYRYEDYTPASFTPD